MRSVFCAIWMVLYGIVMESQLSNIPEFDFVAHGPVAIMMFVFWMAVGIFLYERNNKPWFS